MSSKKDSILTKSRIMAWRQCAKRLWLETYRPELARKSDAQEALFETGRRVGEIARDQNPGGFLIETLTREKALAQTAEFMSSERRPLFEGAFSAEGIFIRADVLLPEGRGWHMVEVKSSTKVKPYQQEDAAIQKYVLQTAGVSVVRTSIAVIDTGFVYQGCGDYTGLLRYFDVSDSIQLLALSAREWGQNAEVTLSRPEPDIETGKQCTEPHECQFRAYCSAGTSQKIFPVSILPHSFHLSETLQREGYEDIRDVPESRLSNPIHKRIRRVTCSGQAELDTAAKSILASLAWPRRYIDFETLGDAIPRWPGTRPFQQIPFQWSCHTEYPDGRLYHEGFLAPHDGEDPRLAFIRTLLNVCGTDGPLLVWNASFERTRIMELAHTFGEYQDSLLRLESRLVDLLPIARNHYYHPEMRGSWSIKSVLPTIAPELNYDELDIGDGGSAQWAYARLLDASAPTDQKNEIAEALRIYCERDTLAMVRVARYLEGR